MITQSHTVILVLLSICVALISSQERARFSSINFLFQTTFTHFHATNGAGRTRPLNTPEFPKRVLTSCDSNLSLHRLFSESGVNDEWGMFVTGLKYTLVMCDWELDPQQQHMTLFTLGFGLVTPRRFRSKTHTCGFGGKHRWRKSAVAVWRVGGAGFDLLLHGKVRSWVNSCRRVLRSVWEEIPQGGIERAWEWADRGCKEHLCQSLTHTHTHTHHNMPLHSTLCLCVRMQNHI